MQINIKYKTFQSLLSQFFKSENDLWPKCQARIISASFPGFSPHALFGGWEGSLKYFFFHLSETFMALKESHMGDQLSKELQLMDNLKFM